MRRSAFTLIELLVVVAIIGLLIAIIVPSLAAARTRGKIAACASNIHQNCIALSNYAALNAGNLPYASSAPSGLLFWDFSTDLASLLTANGTMRSIYYCPLAPDQNVDQLWNFQGGNTYRVMGYFFFLTRNNTSTNYLDSQFALYRVNSMTGGPKHSKSSIIPVGPADDQEIVSDVVIDNQATPPDFTNVSLRGWPGHVFSSNHLAGRGIKATGGNVGFLDGHVEERPLGSMKVRYHVTSDTVNEWF